MNSILHLVRSNTRRIFLHDVKSNSIGVPCKFLKTIIVLVTSNMKADII